MADINSSGKLRNAAEEEYRAANRKVVMLALVSMYDVRPAPSCAKLTRAAHAMLMLLGENALNDIARDSRLSGMMEELRGLKMKEGEVKVVVSGGWHPKRMSMS